MENELDDLQCELVSNASSRCLYHRVIRKLSAESRNKSVMRGRKRKRGAKRVNYRESVWGKQMSASTIPAVGSHTDKEFSKYYKPSLDDVPEKLEKSHNNGETSVQHTQSARQSRLDSEQEIYNTMLSKTKRRSSNNK